MNSLFIADLIVRFQELVGVVPLVVQPLVIAAAAAIPFIEGEVSSLIGVLGGVNPFVAAAAGMAGNFACVLGVVVATSRVRSAVVARVGGRNGEPDEPREPSTPPSKGRQRFARLLDRFGVPGASLLGPLALPTQFTSATLIASGVSVPRVLGWQAAAIVLWTTVATLSATGALALSGA